MQFLMEFTECEPAPTEAEIDLVEERVGLKFPPVLRRVFLEASGGRPTCNCTGADAPTHKDVSECLVLCGRAGSALWTYELFAISKEIIPSHLFPFAVDGGGDCFLADCSSADGNVTLLVHDTAFEHLRPLAMTLEEFWDCSFMTATPRP